jgi:hypothetical protein
MFITDATKNAREAAVSAREGGELVILLRGPHGKDTKREELLHVKGPEESSITLYYHRKNNKSKKEIAN